PNMTSTILEVFSYYFVNAMVTVSAVIFIAGARTMVITTKIKELQYYTKFNEVFVLSLFILGTNLIVKGALGLIIRSKEGKKENEYNESKKNIRDLNDSSNLSRNTFHDRLRRPGSARRLRGGSGDLFQCR